MNRKYQKSDYVNLILNSQSVALGPFVVVREEQNDFYHLMTTKGELFPFLVSAYNLNIYNVPLENQDATHLPLLIPYCPIPDEDSIKQAIEGRKCAVERRPNSTS